MQKTKNEKKLNETSISSINNLETCASGLDSELKTK